MNLKQEKLFYKTLYSSSNIDIDEMKLYLNNTTFEHVLNENEASMCEGILTYSECEDAVNNMKKIKAQV